MAMNGGRSLGMYDELSAFLKIKLYNNRGLTDSHELAMFLELFNGNPWTRTTSKLLHAIICMYKCYNYCTCVFTYTLSN